MSAPKTSILLVDDKPQRLLTYLAILDSLDLNIVEAASGEEALRRLEATDFAAILLDVNMPGLDGFETAQRIRERAQTPIIFVTGVHLSDMDRIRAYEMGAADYVFIPIVPEILRAKIKVLVQLHEQRREVTLLNERLVDAYEDLGRAHRQLKADNMRELKKLNESLALTNSKLQLEIGEKRNAEEQLRKASQRKDEFISILAHELRNPLSAIQSAMELLQLASLAESQKQWAGSLMNRQVEHLVRLIDDLLDVSRVTNGRVQLKCKVIDLRQIVHDSIDSMRSQIEQRRHRLEIDLPDEPLIVDGDAVRLGQVFANLLSNATKYMRDGGCIEVKAVRNEQEDRAVVCVTDLGAGLEADMLEHVFELFAQAKRTGSHSQSGLGIGLALVRNLVELHGGNISAQSEGPDRGSRFIVDLPLSHSMARSAVEDGHVRTVPPLRLLVIDDNVDAASALARLLEQTSHHEVHIAHDGERGINAAMDLRPDVVLLDIGLPDIDGHEVAKRLRALPQLDGVRLVAITGFRPEQIETGSEGTRFDRMLTKPIGHADLERVLSELEEARRAAGRQEISTGQCCPDSKSWNRRRTRLSS